MDVVVGSMVTVVRWAAIALAWLWLAGVARADDFSGTSPGPMSSSHASLDTAEHCNDCHNGSGKALSADKCLACHDHNNLKARIDASKGFHASSLVKGKACESCHLEHKGRGYDIMGWRSVAGGQQGFNHDLEGWPLGGKHAAIECKDCHKLRDHQGLQTFLGADKLCGSCHKKDSPHQFSASDRKELLVCERCHGESVWKPAKSTMQFDHNDKRDAAMPLLGPHADVSCAKCHPKSVFNLQTAKPDNCGNSGCHTSPHAGQIFAKPACDACHSPTYGSLQKFKFDHDTKTKFALGPAHGKLECISCHTKQLGEQKPNGACEVCHAKDSKHGDRFVEFGSPPKCATCHSSGNAAWKPIEFNHSRTQFKLTGKHAEVSCRSCHLGNSPAEFERFNPKSVGCMGCHQHQNVHEKKFTDKQCVGCHKAAGVLDVKRDAAVKEFHGPTSRFPLVKAHKTVACAQCHLNGKFEHTPIECGERCHQDSLHRGSLGTTCSRCHSPGIWEATRFDHNNTKFPLKGLHTTIPTCDSCHPKRVFAGTPTNCGAVGCHAIDDAHKGRLGDKCGRCHVETGDNIFSHNTMARFQLTGKHLQVRCVDCHPSMSFKPRPTTCFGCHPEPDVHRGQYGTACEQCHTTKTFGDIRPMHDVGDFSLKGGHDNLACARCHRDDRPLAGSGNLCINCHRQDDIHSNSLSPRCGECHTQWSFAPARFDHTRVGCSLTAVHRTLPCFDCHKSGNFGGLSGECASCHRELAARKGGVHASYTTCGNCHNANSWTFNSGTGTGRESVCR